VGADPKRGKRHVALSKILADSRDPKQLRTQDRDGTHLAADEGLVRYVEIGPTGASQSDSRILGDVAIKYGYGAGYAFSKELDRCCGAVKPLYLSPPMSGQGCTTNMGTCACEWSESGLPDR